jgi:hypothetical protein
MAFTGFKAAFLISSHRLIGWNAEMRIKRKYHIYPQRIPLSFVNVLVLCLVLSLAGSYGYAYDGNYPALRDCIDPDFQAAFEKTLETRFGKTLQDLAKASKKADPEAEVYRKSGTWKTFHSDSGIINQEENEYIIVALVEHEKGGEVLVDLITAVEELMDQRNR